MYGISVAQFPKKKSHNTNATPVDRLRGLRKFLEVLKHTGIVYTGTNVIIQILFAKP